MKTNVDLTPIFYTRGLNAPYTEGHIQIARMITRSLFVYGIRSVVFNFKYRVEESASRIASSSWTVEQKIPLVDRDDVLSGRSGSLHAYSLVMESLKMPRFFSVENTLNRHNCVVNIVNCFRYPRIFVKKLLKTPLVLHFYLPNLRGGCMVRFLANKADLVIASSKRVAEYLGKRGIAEEKTAIVYPPVDTELYKPSHNQLARSNLDLPTEARVILYMGDLKPKRFPEDKVLQVVAELRKTVPEAMLLVFTPKSNQNIRRAQEIRQKARSLKLAKNLRICVRSLSEKEKAGIYAASEVFFFPQTGPKVAVEPPLTVLEAMASGVVVFAPKHSASSEIITHRDNGFLFEEEDYDNLAQRFADVLANGKLRTRLSRGARQTADQELSFRTIGLKMLQHFTALGSC